MSASIEIFLSGVLKGSPQSRKRHLMQAAQIQIAIEQRWGLKHPSQWRHKHLRWFLQEHLKTASDETRYRYWLTSKELVKRLDKTNDWIPILKGPWTQRSHPDQP